MLCSQCKKKEANVHFSGLVNGKAIKVELCEDCAKTSHLTAPFMGSGITGLFMAPFSFASAAQPALTELLELLSTWHTKSTGSALSKSHCPVCHWTLAQLQKTGRMGCAECYSHFHAEVSNLLKKIHGQTVHKGKRTPVEAAKTKTKDTRETLDQLRLDLEKAVQEEKFEWAADLRDKIRDLENKSP